MFGWYQFPRGKCPFCFPCPANAHAIIDKFISGSTNKTSSSNETKKCFWLIVSTSYFLAFLAIVQCKNMFGDDFQWNQVSFQHLCRSGGGDESPASPPVSAPAHNSNSFSFCSVASARWFHCANSLVALRSYPPLREHWIALSWILAVSQSCKPGQISWVQLGFGLALGLSLSKYFWRFRACIQIFFATTHTFFASCCWSNRVE